MRMSAPRKSTVLRRNMDPLCASLHAVIVGLLGIIIYRNGRKR